VATMRIIPRAVLEAAAHEAYVRHFANVPAPKILNLEALLAFGLPRKLHWASVEYDVPPLGFREGMQLHVTAIALRDLRRQGAPPDRVRSMVRLARHLMRSVVRPSRGWRRRCWSWLAVPVRNASEMEQLCYWLLDVPDEIPVAPPADAITVDIVDQIANFAREFGAWCGPDGLPLSWAHYCYGLKHVHRSYARQDLRHAIAGRAAQADQKSFREWSMESRAAAGW
jgi:hypothetical protein